MHCTIIEIRSTTYKQQPQKICLLIATKVPPRLSSTLNQIVQNWHFRNFIIAWSLSLHLFFFCVLLLNWRQSHQSPWTSAESARARIWTLCDMQGKCIAQCCWLLKRVTLSHSRILALDGILSASKNGMRCMKLCVCCGFRFTFTITVLCCCCCRYGSFASLLPFIQEYDHSRRQ